MDNIDLLKGGLLLMIMGLGFVFVFLTVMICVMNVNAKIMKVLGKYFPEKVEEEQTVSKKRAVLDNGADIALAIACALKKRGNIC